MPELAQGSGRGLPGVAQGSRRGLPALGARPTRRLSNGRVDCARDASSEHPLDPHSTCRVHTREPEPVGTLGRVTTLIAEDLLLLLLHDEKGTVSSAHADVALGGALLIELALAEAVVVRERTSIWSSAKVAAVPGTGVEDPVLAEALRRVAERERAASDLVNRLGKGTRAALTDRLVQRGILRREDDKVLGLFPRTRWPEADGQHEDAVRGLLTAVLVQGLDPDPRTAALVALLHALSIAPAAVDRGPVPARDVRRRAQEVAEGAWAAKAVQDAITATTAAAVAAITASTAATTAATT